MPKLDVVIFSHFTSAKRRPILLRLTANVALPVNDAGRLAIDPCIRPTSASAASQGGVEYRREQGRIKSVATAMEAANDRRRRSHVPRTLAAVDAATDASRRSLRCAICSYSGKLATLQHGCQLSELSSNNELKCVQGSTNLRADDLTAVRDNPNDLETQT